MLAHTYSAGTGSDKRMKSEIFHIKGLTRLKHSLKVNWSALLFVTFGGSNAPLPSAENTIKLLRWKRSLSSLFTELKLQLYSHDAVTTWNR